MINLRQLCEKDATGMIEWMRDPYSQKGFLKNMADVSLDDARSFCQQARINAMSGHEQNMHLAIVNDKDEYLGTISLKNINYEHLSAEFAITLRKKARGQGVAVKAAGLMLKKGYEEIGLHRIYLTVLADNIVAIRFYEKCGFIFEGELRDHIFKNGKYISWKIYGMLDNEYFERKELW